MRNAHYIYRHLTLNCATPINGDYAFIRDGLQTSCLTLEYKLRITSKYTRYKHTLHSLTFYVQRYSATVVIVLYIFSSFPPKRQRHIVYRVPRQVQVQGSCARRSCCQARQRYILALGQECENERVWKGHGWTDLWAAHKESSGRPRRCVEQAVCSGMHRSSASFLLCGRHC